MNGKIKELIQSEIEENILLALEIGDVGYLEFVHCFCYDGNWGDVVRSGRMTFYFYNYSPTKIISIPRHMLNFSK